MNTEVLNRLGLNNSEIKVYFALLELESSTVGRIIDRAKVPDSKIYSILEKLKEKGLVSFVIKNNVKHFQATDPCNLIELLNEKSEQIEEQKRILREEIIPNIEQQRKLTEEKQEATVYEGMEGLKSAFNVLLTTIKPGMEYYAFMVGLSPEDKKVERFFLNYHQKRIQQKIRIKLIAEKKREKSTEKNISRFRQYLAVKYTDEAYPVGTIIFDGHIMLLGLSGKTTAFIIKSQQIYEHYKKHFESLWNRVR